MNEIHTIRPVELLHMDLMGPTQTKKFGMKEIYFFNCGYFSRFTWIILLREKFETFDLAKKLLKRLITELKLSIFKIRSDHDK